MNVRGLVIHPAAQAALQNYLTQPAHAVLLSGPLGIGKAQLARHLAAKLLQVDSLEQQAYFREVSSSKGTIPIEDIRTLITFFRLSVPGAQAIKRVALIADAETMSREAQNALLKLLEEPPVGTALILTSSYPERLLPTIRSRVQGLLITAPEQTAIIKHFTTLGFDEVVVSRTLLRTGSNLSQATQLLTANQAGKQDELLELVKRTLTGTPYDRMLLVDGLVKQKEQAAAYVSTLSATAMASLQAAAGKNPASIPRWQAILVASQTAGDALSRSGNTKLVLTELMLAL